MILSSESPTYIRDTAASVYFITVSVRSPPANEEKQKAHNLISQVGTNGIRPNQIPARIVAAQIPHSSAPLKCPLCLDLIVAVPYRRIRLILQFLDLPAVFYFRRRSTRIQNRLVIVVGTSIYSLPRLIAELVHN